MSTTKSKWPDFLFTLAVRLGCGAVLGCLLCVLLGYRGILGSFSRNHIRTVEIWVSLWGIGGAVIAALTTPRWQTPWYRGIASPRAWNRIPPGLDRQTIVARLGEPSSLSDDGEDVWLDRNWQLWVRYDENGQAIEVLRRSASE